MKLKKWTSSTKKYKLTKVYKQNNSVNSLTEGELSMENTIKRPCTPIESLKQSLIEMNFIRKNNLPRKNLDDLLDQLEREIEEEE